MRKKEDIRSANAADKDLLDTRDLSALMGRSTRRVLQALQSGDLPLPVLRVGRAVFVPRSAWQAWVNSAAVAKEETHAG